MGPPPGRQAGGQAGEDALRASAAEAAAAAAAIVAAAWGGGFASRSRPSHHGGAALSGVTATAAGAAQRASLLGWIPSQLGHSFSKQQRPFPVRRPQLGPSSAARPGSEGEGTWPGERGSHVGGTRGGCFGLVRRAGGWAPLGGGGGRSCELPPRPWVCGGGG